MSPYTSYMNMKPKIVFFVILEKFFTLIFHTFSIMFTIVKWTVAPFVLFFQIVVLWPLAILKIKLTDKAIIKESNEDALCDDIWRLLQEQKDLLKSEGYDGGDKLYYVDLFDGDTRVFIYPMINESKRLGVGLNFATIKDQTNNYNILDSAYAEFTIVCEDGLTLDLHNNYKDISLNLEKRERYFFDDHDFDLLKLSKTVELISEKTKCYSHKESLRLLKEDPKKIFKDEIETVFKAFKSDNIIEKSKLTFSGAFKIISETLWPLRVLNNKKKYEKTLDFLDYLQIEPNKISYYNDFSKKIRYHQPLETLKELETYLQNPDFRFGFSPKHETTWIVFYIENEKVTNVVVNFQEITRYEKRDAIKISQYEIEFLNEELVCSYDGFGEVIYDAYESEIQQSIKDDLSSHIPLQTSLEIAKDKTDIVNITMITAEIKMQKQTTIWEIALQNDKEFQTIILDAKNGQIIKIKKPKTLFY